MNFASDFFTPSRNPKCKYTKAFTLVDICIVTAIIGLAATMAIPAFQKVKFYAIEKRINQGIKVKKEELEYYKKYKAGQKSTTQVQFKIEEEVKLDGNDYIVIRNKEQMKEVVIDGQTVYLIEK